MLGRKRHRRRPPLPFRYVLMISIIIFTLLTVQGLWIVNAGIEPTLLEIANVETQRIARNAINDAVDKKIVSDFEDLQEKGELVITEKDSNGKITRATIRTDAVNRVLAQATDRAQDYLNRLEKGEINQYTETPDDINVELADEGDYGIIQYIPLGQATGNALLANFGPKVPVRFTSIGEVQANPETTTKLVGINNVWIEINITLEVNVNIVIPFATDTEKITTDIPVVMTLINGEVPEFYAPGSDTPPAIDFSN